VRVCISTGESFGAGWHFSETVVHITEKKQRSNNVMDEERVLLDDVLTSDGDVAYIEEQCHDCGAAVCVRVTKETDGYLFEAQKGAAQYAPTIEDDTCLFYKCQKCYEEEPILKKWRPTEVYTRVVGYYRPVSKFNKGKQEEYKHRKNYEGML
jgi:hypothetical protein